MLRVTSAFYLESYVIILELRWKINHLNVNKEVSEMNKSVDDSK